MCNTCQYFDVQLIIVDLLFDHSHQDQYDVCHKGHDNLVDVTIGLAIKF